MDIFNLHRYFWDYSYDNPERIKPNHAAVYYFAIELCNRLGWKEKFGYPSEVGMEATGIKSYSVFKKTFDDLVNFGFFDIIEYSKNQHSSNIISLKGNYKKNSKKDIKALDKAILNNVSKKHSRFERILQSTLQSTLQSALQSECESTLQSTYESTVSIDIPLNNYTTKQQTTKQLNISFDDFWNLYEKRVGDKTKIIKKWESLKDEERQAAMIHIPKYKIAQPEKTYRKDPSTYLNNKSFNDEIISLTTAPPPMNYNGQMQQPVKRDYRSEMFKNKNGNWEHPELGVVSIDYVHLGKTAAELSEMCQRGELD